MCGRPMGGSMEYISGIEEGNAIADADGGVAVVEGL